MNAADSTPMRAKAQARTPSRWLAAILLAGLGLARGAGGVFMLRGGAAAGLGSRPDAPAWLIGAGLVLVGLLCLVASGLTLRRARSALWTGVAGLVLFVAGGLMNGTLLYGSPRMAGTVANVVYALVTFAALWLATGRSAAPR